MMEIRVPAHVFSTVFRPKAKEKATHVELLFQDRDISFVFELQESTLRALISHFTQHQIEWEGWNNEQRRAFSGTELAIAQRTARMQDAQSAAKPSGTTD